jgi:hypothetical protein
VRSQPDYAKAQDQKDGYMNEEVTEPVLSGKK